jgi:hypothetical protein
MAAAAADGARAAAPRPAPTAAAAAPAATAARPRLSSVKPSASPARLAAAAPAAVAAAPATAPAAAAGGGGAPEAKRPLTVATARVCADCGTDCSQRGKIRVGRDYCQNCADNFGPCIACTQEKCYHSAQALCHACGFQPKQFQCVRPNCRKVIKPSDFGGQIRQGAILCSDCAKADDDRLDDGDERV